MTDEYCSRCSFVRMKRLGNGNMNRHPHGMSEAAFLRRLG
jgi:hypothetical protein